MYPVDRNPYKYKDAQDVLNEGKDNTICKQLQGYVMYTKLET